MFLFVCFHFLYVFNSNSLVKSVNDEDIRYWKHALLKLSLKTMVSNFMVTKVSHKNDFEGPSRRLVEVVKIFLLESALFFTYEYSVFKRIYSRISE